MCRINCTKIKISIQASMQFVTLQRIGCSCINRVICCFKANIPNFSISCCNKWQDCVTLCHKEGTDEKSDIFEGEMKE